MFLPQPPANPVLEYQHALPASFVISVSTSWKALVLTLLICCAFYTQIWGWVQDSSFSLEVAASEDRNSFGELDDVSEDSTLQGEVCAVKMDGSCSAGESHGGRCWVQTQSLAEFASVGSDSSGELPRVFLQQCQKNCITWCSVQLVQKTEHTAWDSGILTAEIFGQRLHSGPLK